MRILHLCLASAFTDDMKYQENLLVDQMCKDGHDVIIIADANKYIDGVIVKTAEEDIYLRNGARLIRKKYRFILNNFFSEKIRAVKGLYNLIASLEPDLIFVHGPQTYEMLTIRKYVSRNSKCKLYVDCHEDYFNSAKNLLSKYILHAIFYKFLIYVTSKYVEKFLYITYDTFLFVKEMYNIPSYSLEYYPLGGIIYPTDARVNIRSSIRKEYGILDDDIVLVHSGKFTQAKKTIDLLEAFSNNKSNKLHLLLIGTVDETLQSEVHNFMLNDKRIKFLGWKSGDELINILHGADIYIQPGSQSATMQVAACCNLALALFPYKSHKYLFDDSVFYIENTNQIIELLKTIVENPDIILEKKKRTFEIAIERLDYKVLSRRITS